MARTSNLQPVMPQSGGAVQPPTPSASARTHGVSSATMVFVLAAVALVGAIALAMKSGKGAVYQRHAALIGGIVGFCAGFSGCQATDNRPGAFTFTLLAGAVCSLPGFIVGFLAGKKER